MSSLSFWRSVDIQTYCAVPTEKYFSNMANPTRLYQTVVGLSRHLVDQIDEKQILIDRAHTLQIQNSFMRRDKENMIRQNQNTLLETRRRERLLEAENQNLKGVLNKVTSLVSSLRTQLSSTDKAEVLEQIFVETQNWCGTQSVRMETANREPHSESNSMEEDWALHEALNGD